MRYGQSPTSLIWPKGLGSQHRHESYRRTRRLKLMIAFLCALLLQGCLLSRLVTSRQQLCNDEISLSLEERILVVFDQPTLYDDDIKKILGQSPSSETVVGNLLLYQYRITRKGDSSGSYDIPVTFQFTRKDGRYRLAKAQASKNVKDFLPPELLEPLFRCGCDGKLRGNEIEIDLAGLDLTQLPKIEEIKTLLGEPHERNGNKCIYYYRLNSSDTVEIVISFHPKEEKMSTVRITYFRYVLDVDFDNRVARGRLKDISNMFALGFLITLSP
jgi:hypothetical protein